MVVVDRSRELLKEAQRASALSNPRIASVYDVFLEVHDELFLVMEFVDGVSLRERRMRQSPVDLDAFQRIAAQCVEGLAAAHQAIPAW
jgi:serine/threonine protein kinase